MSKPETVSSITLPAPTGGLDFYNPLAAMSQSNTPWMVNVDTDNRLVTVRNGYTIFATITYAPDFPSIKGMVSYGTGTNEVLYVYTSITGGRRIYKIDQAGTVTPEFSDVVTAGNVVAYKFASNLAFPQDNALGVGIDTLFFNQAVGTWAAWTLRYNGFVFPVAGISIFYKGRLYGRTDYSNLQAIAYGDVGQIQGAVPIANLFSVGTLFYFSGKIAYLGTFVVSNEAQTKEYFAAGNDAGEILIYSGDSPAADNWNLEARVKTAAPIVSNSGIGASTLQYENDCLVFTYAGIVSLRNLYLNQDKAKEEGNSYFSLPINNFWIKLVADIPFVSYSTQHEYITAAFAEKDRRLYFMIPRALDINGAVIAEAYTIFIYSLDGGSWSMHQVSDKIFGDGQSGNITYFNGGIYFWSSNKIMKLDPTKWLDQDCFTIGNPYYGYDFAIHGAPTTFDDSVATKVVQGYEPLIRQQTSVASPLRCGFGLKVSTDFGRKESGASSPAQTTEFAKRMYSVGAEGTFFQYKLEGNTATTSGTTTTSLGLDLFAINAFYKKGGVL